MINWKKRIINTFVKKYFASAAKTGKNRESLLIRSPLLFPDFDAAHPDEKESYLEAAEALQQKGVAILTWEKGKKGEALRTIRCENFKRLFREAGKPYPQAEVDKIKTMLGERAQAMKESLAARDGKHGQAEKVIAFLEFLSRNFSLKEIGQGLDPQTMEDLATLFEFACDTAQLEKITTRALSILLYQDSKRLETLPALYSPLLSRVQKAVPVPDISFLARSYPETMISGKIIFEYKDAAPPLVNARGLILNLPFESAETFGEVKLLTDKQEKTVLTIENKETFYALGSPQKFNASDAISRYDCFLYTGGYPNRAAAALIKILAASGFSFYHAGDLDPDGVLIMQNVQDIAERPVAPVRMDAAAFNQYRAWGRQLTPAMLRQAVKIRQDTRAIPGIAGLLHCIEETGIGIEQEIVDYR
ncbi:MAG: DUF2399 domain-containing protein [Treponema sp.]|nr:DUF2399 domain-containing protein [Treponema sp.]